MPSVPLIVLTWSLTAPPAPQPAAMVLSVKGQVEVRPDAGQPRRIGPKGLLYDADRLSVPAGGEATIVFFDGGLKLRVKPGATITIRPGGATAADAVERLGPVDGAVARTLRGLRARPGDERVAASTFRAIPGAPIPPPAVTPAYDAAVMSDRPTLSWKADRGPYTVRLRTAGSSRDVWTAQTAGTSLPYPDGEAPLRRGITYLWAVSDPDGRTVIEGRFSVVTRGEFRELAALRERARGSEPSGLLEAALTFEQHGVYDEAAAAYERLAAQNPDEPVFRAALAELRQRAGLAEKGRP